MFSLKTLADKSFPATGSSCCVLNLFSNFMLLIRPLRIINPTKAIISTGNKALKPWCDRPSCPRFERNPFTLVCAAQGPALHLRVLASLFSKKALNSSDLWEFSERFYFFMSSGLALPFLAGSSSRTHLSSLLFIWRLFLPIWFLPFDLEKFFVTSIYKIIPWSKNSVRCLVIGKIARWKSALGCSSTGFI